jgi:hypothetical protein
MTITAQPPTLNAGDSNDLNPDALERAARHHGARLLTDGEQAAHRAALADLLAAAQAVIDGTNGGLHLATPDGLELAPVHAATLRFASEALGDLIASVRSGDLWTATASHPEDDYDDPAVRLYALTGEQLDQRDHHHYRRGYSAALASGEVVELG